VLVQRLLPREEKTGRRQLAELGVAQVGVAVVSRMESGDGGAWSGSTGFCSRTRRLLRVFRVEVGEMRSVSDR
jgi:hypothetical protein